MTNIKKQKGMVTLFSSIMLMLLISLNVFIGAKGSVVEQKSANNQYRTEEAAHNAEAGIAKVIENIKAFIITNPTATNFDAVRAVSENKYSASYDSATKTITSVGTGSGDATRKVTQRIILNGSLGGGPAALNALGNINLRGNSSATDVKAGGTVSTQHSDSIDTPGGSNASEFKVTLLDHEGNTLLDSSGNAVTRSMTSDEYFMYFFSGLCPTAKSTSNAADCKNEAKATIIANTSTGFYCASNCASLDDSNLTSQYTAGKRIFWLEGGLNHKFTLGSVADPVIMLVMNVVDGGASVHINSNSTLNGILYVDILDQRTTINCSCNATGTATSNASLEVDHTSVLGPPTTQDSTVTCERGATGWNVGPNNKCKYTIYDNYSNAFIVITDKGQKLQIFNSATYLSSYSATWNLSNIRLNSNQPSACTVSACSAAAIKCTPATSSSTVTGSTGSCSYSASAVSGTNNTPFEIEITGTWDNSGGGNALINGAAITSGSFSGQGTIEFIRNSTAITNAALMGITGSGFNSTPASITIDPHGWSDAI